MIASNYMSLDSVSKSKVRQWVEKIADKLNIEIGQSDQDVIDLLNTIARKTATGTEITEGDLASLSKFEGGTNVKNPSDALPGADDSAPNFCHSLFSKSQTLC